MGRARKTGLGKNPLEWIQDTSASPRGVASTVKELPIERVVESERFKLRVELPDVAKLAAMIRAMAVIFLITVSCLLVEKTLR